VDDPSSTDQENMPMAYTFRCADSGSPCPGQFTSETTEELMWHVEVHAHAAHPDLVMDDGAVAMITGMVREV
jgi:predicted small metal-binding protein